MTTRRLGRPFLTDATMLCVFNALQRLAVHHGSMAAAARVVGCSRETVRLILTESAGVSPDLSQRILDAAADVPAAEPASGTPDGPEDERSRIERATEQRRAAADALRYDPRPAADAPAPTSSPMDTLAALVATLLVRHTTDPIAEIDPKRSGCFAHRVEHHVLSLLFAQYGNWNQVALATRGRPVGATIQRNVERHEFPQWPMSPELAHEVQELLDEDTGAWAALLDAFADGEERAAE